MLKNLFSGINGFGHLSRAAQALALGANADETPAGAQRAG